MSRNKAILITGTSSGIGRACALHLDELGYKIYAGVRKKTDGEKLKLEATENLSPLILDVTNTDSIIEAVSTVEEETGGQLFGLINNAGIGQSGALEIAPVSAARKLMDVNVIGLMAVTKACIPMLRESSGRIINIGSTSCFLAFPGASAYSASKFAVRAISDSLRLELKPLGVSVTLVAPGAVESEIWDKGKAFRDGISRDNDPEIVRLYEPLIKFGSKLTEIVKKIPASVVAKEVVKALSVKKPKPYYIVGNDAKGAAKTAKLPRRLLDWIISKRIQIISQQT